ncbi:MAG: YdeI/OmpD-associated family protein [Verrucomicrobiales bacterium]|nr:YdeI/OmpD-associated family protein [Verrucomicrobiales bacterium]
MLKPDAAKIMTFKSPEDLSKWLQSNHTFESELWVKIFKKGSGVVSVNWNEVVIESLCWGWIDGIKKSLGDHAYLQRITPRKPRSNWSKRNTEHIERLIIEGRMQESGLVPVRAAKADGRWENAYSVSKMKVPADFLAALDDRPEAKRFYETLTKANRYSIAQGLESAKKSETRQRRFEKFMEMLICEEKPDLGSKKGKKTKNNRQALEVREIPFINQENHH